MNTSGKIKILICDMNNTNGSMLQTMFVNRGFNNVVFQRDITELKKKVYAYKPDVIISGNHLWEDKQGIRFITELSLPRKAHIIIWYDKLSQDIISKVFNKSNLHLVRTNNEKELIEIIKKVELDDD